MKRILILANSDVGLYKFRKELIERLIADGNEIFISLPKGNNVKFFEDIGCHFIDTYVDRRGINPIKDLKLFISYLKMIKKTNPDIILTYTIKPNIYGSLASRFKKKEYIVNITGLGTMFQKNNLLKKLVTMLYKFSLKDAKCIFFQNQHNLNVFLKSKIINKKYELLPGSGVNLQEHKLEKYYEEDKIKLLYLGRIMKEKGIDELLKAIKLIKKEYQYVEFEIIGPYEDNYEKIIENEVKLGNIIYHGYQHNVHNFIKNNHALVLPSHHEGLSNVLLEAAACGRAVIASNIPGCIETFDNNISGYSFECKNHIDLYEKIIKFISLSKNEREQMGLNGRAKVEREYDRNIVVEKYLKEIY